MKCLDCKEGYYRELKTKWGTIDTCNKCSRASKHTFKWTFKWGGIL